ncbi:hypothetical protein HZC07_02655 [Candidatus Micrarchaeota archaeon]|nr:hypothetical protein [Candidatus Micrarchaeota archaeon]
MKKPPREILILIGTLVLFLITNAIFRDGPLNFIPTLVAIAIVVEIIAFVGIEVKQGAQEHGWKHEIVDTIMYGASFILNTSSPVSAVVSCSMLPNLWRGDFVIVQGAPVNAYQITLSESELRSLTNSPTTMFYGNASVTINGSIFPYCLRYSTSAVCEVFASDPDNLIEQKGVFTYKYTKCPITLSNGSKGYQPCLKSVVFKGTEYTTNFSNDVIVYQPPAGDLYSQVGDIVHRAFFVITVNNESNSGVQNKFYLTRGDNNPILDLQVSDPFAGKGNSPIPQDRARGKVILRVPYLGYFKLFLSGYLKEDSQCKTQLEFPVVR